MSEVPLYPSVAVLGVFSAVDVRGCGAVCVSLGAGESLVSTSRLGTNLLVQSLHPAASSSVAAPCRFRLFSRKREKGREGEGGMERERGRGRGGGELARVCCKTILLTSLALAAEEEQPPDPGAAPRSRRCTPQPALLSRRPPGAVVVLGGGVIPFERGTPVSCSSCAGFLFERTADAPP